ncbi:hypothetical protein EC988_004025, partial [Linderina pennispora]
DDQRWRARQREWEQERAALEAEKATLHDLVRLHEAKAMEPPRPPTPLPSPKRDSAMQTDPEEKEREKEPEEEPEGEKPAVDAQFAAQLGGVMAEAYQELAARLVASLEQQFDSQTTHLGSLTQAVNTLATSTTAKLDESLQTQLREQKKGMESLAALLQAPGGAQRVPSIASPAYSGTVRTRLSIGSTHARRPASMVDDGSASDSQPKSVVATLVNEISKNASNESPKLPGRGSLGWNASPQQPRVSRAERRVSAGMASDTLSGISSKCDKLSGLFEQYAADIDQIKKAQGSLLAVCNALALESRAESLHEPSTPITDHTMASDASLRRSRRKTEHLRRRAAAEAFSPLGRSPEPEPPAVDLYKAATDELIASLRAQLAEATSAKATAEKRAAELLEWIGRESKGRATLEDMIRTAQEACKAAEDKLARLHSDAEMLRSAVAIKDDEIKRLQALVQTRDNELRHLRRASRKALDQLADLKQAPDKPDSGKSDNDKPAADAELQEAAALHVKMQFEISRLEGQVSRLEDENAQLAKELAQKDSLMSGLRSKLADSERRHNERANEASDGIRVRPVDADERFASIGSKSHKRFKVQLQNMQKHIEYLETKLALAVSENDALKSRPGDLNASIPSIFNRSIAESASGMAMPSTPDNRSSSSLFKSAGSAKPGPRSAGARPASSIFPNLPSNMDYMQSSRPMSMAGPTAAEQPSSRPRQESFSSSFERLRSPFKGFRKHFG